MSFKFGAKRLVGTGVDDVSAYPPVDPGVRADGDLLFDQFVMDQINHQDEVTRLRVELPPSTPVPMTSSDLSDAATRLCQLAASFANTDERKLVKETAMAIDTNISCEDLTNLLITMIQNTHHLEEGIVVLFYFCFDLALRVLEGGFADFWEFLAWCKEAIVRAVGPHVQAQGGWHNVIKMAAGGSAFLGMVATGFFVAARVGVMLFW